MSEDWLERVRWTADGLVPAIAQDAASGRVLMMAWMNRESLALTAREGRAVYWSRSRRALWHKGEESGHVQRVKDIRLDCDGDTVLLAVEQVGGIACHTGRERCFYQQLQGDQWVSVEPVLKEPAAIYGKGPGPS
jgi:phosphoribosyl-AMP cyclohydrolase